MDDLKDKMLKAFDDVEISVKTGNRNREEALSALEVLGFARKAARHIGSNHFEEIVEPDIIEVDGYQTQRGPDLDLQNSSSDGRKQLGGNQICGKNKCTRVIESMLILARY